MHLTHASLLSVVALQSFCVASPHSLISTISSTHGKRSTPMNFVSILGDLVALDNVARRSAKAGATSIPAGYSVDGRCGSNYGGLMCNPDSTLYIVSDTLPTFRAMCSSNLSGNVLLCKLFTI